jgi:hypothetical protein
MIIKTKICPGRDLTKAEQNAIELKLSEAVTAGTTNGQVTRVPPDDSVLRTNTRVWSTLEAANGWVEFMNASFSPVSAEVVEE